MQGMLRDMARLLALALLVAIAAPAPGTAPDPSASGPFAVGVTTLTLTDASRGRTLVTEVWYPADSAGRDVAVRRGRYPLVLVAHGNCGFRTNYEYLTIPLAGWGFMVAAPDFPGFNKTDCDNHVPGGDTIGEPPRDLSFLRTTFHDQGGPAAVFAGSVRGRRTGLAGHSLGGAAVINASRSDADMTAVVPLAPLAGSAQGQAFHGLRPRRSVLVVGGSADTTLAFDAFAAPFFAALPAPSFLLKVIGGTHSGFTDMDSRLAPGELARQQALTRRYAVAFLKRYLAHERRFRRVLTAEDAAAQGTDLELTARPR